jgi:hypothetical protein
MATVDLSLIQSYLPILAFLLVFTVVFAVLAKTKLLGESKFVNLLVSFIVATLFVAATSMRDYVIKITPWFAVFVIALLFILAIVGFSGKVPDMLKNGLGIVFVIGLLILFLVSAFYSFSSEPYITSVTDWITTPRVYGVFLLIAASAIASWILVRKGGKKD